MGVRAVSRFTGFEIKTILSILESAGIHCAAFLNAKVKNVQAKFVEADEVFSYVYKKPNGEPDTNNDSKIGECWTFFAMAKDEKLIINHLVGKRTGENAIEFLKDLRDRVPNRFQLVTDGFRGYCAVTGSGGNVRDILGDRCEYATETKTIMKDETYTGQRAFFAPKKVRVKRTPRFGFPNLAHATTNHAERLNLNLRTFSRRFVRCTLNFSKKYENHCHAVAIFVATFNFCRVHKSLNGQSPAMAAGLTDHVWTVRELLGATI